MRLVGAGIRRWVAAVLAELDAAEQSVERLAGRGVLALEDEQVAVPKDRAEREDANRSRYGVRVPDAAE